MNQQTMNDIGFTMTSGVIRRLIMGSYTAVTLHIQSSATWLSVEHFVQANEK